MYYFYYYYPSSSYYIDVLRSAMTTATTTTTIRQAWGVMVGLEGDMSREPDLYKNLLGLGHSDHDIEVER